MRGELCEEGSRLWRREPLVMRRVRLVDCECNWKRKSALARNVAEASNWSIQTCFCVKERYLTRLLHQLIFGLLEVARVNTISLICYQVTRASPALDGGVMLCCAHCPLRAEEMYICRSCDIFWCLLAVGGSPMSTSIYLLTGTWYPALGFRTTPIMI